MSSDAPGTLVVVLKELYYEIQQLWPGFKQYFENFFYAVIAPLAVTVGVSGSLLYIWLVIRKWIFPPTAKELLLEAIMLLQEDRRDTVLLSLGDDDDGTAKRRKPSRAARQAEALLKKAITRNKVIYEPAVLSLAAYYIYRRRDADQALTLLVDLKSTPKVDILRLDAKALKEGHGRMVSALIGEDTFLSLRSAQTEGR